MEKVECDLLAHTDHCHTRPEREVSPWSRTKTMCRSRPWSRTRNCSTGHGRGRGSSCPCSPTDVDSRSCHYHMAPDLGGGSRAATGSRRREIRRLVEDEHCEEEAPVFNTMVAQLSSPSSSLPRSVYLRIDQLASLPPDPPRAGVTNLRRRG